mmetsp:Transcript_1851/g.3326  ORF Transcript_1851/g.3326 Transcript_1851/m.3326 type:complete len:96 (+) Transcript_1851:555-842(+)
MTSATTDSHHVLRDLLRIFAHGPGAITKLAKVVAPTGKNHTIIPKKEAVPLTSGDLKSAQENLDRRPAVNNASIPQLPEIIAPNSPDGPIVAELK